nr:hypothetical protein [Armatimonas sp.]
MTNRTTPRFWEDYNALPKEIRDVADKNFRLLEESPEHPSLQLKRIDELWSVRAGIRYRALGIDDPEEDNTILWFWIGSHAEYDKLVANQ